MTTNLIPYDPHAALATTFDYRAHVSPWLDDLQQRVNAQEISADTRTGYRRGAEKFIDWLNDRILTPEEIRAWKAGLADAAGTRHSTRSAARAG